MPKPAGRKKRGVFITALALAAMAVPLATGALALSATLSPKAQVASQQAREELRSKGLDEYLRARLESPQGWQAWVSTTSAPAAGPTPLPALPSTTPSTTPSVEPPAPAAGLPGPTPPGPPSRTRGARAE
jgi:hypothetical protein